MPRPKLESCTRILVVEGYDDLLAYAEILEHVSNYDEKVFIKDMGGRSNIVTKLETFLSPALLAPGQKAAIGVIVDADKDGAGISRSLEVRLTKITGQSVKAGAWTDGQPRIGLYVASGADGTGEIETLVWEAWSQDPANSAAKGCVDGFLDCMKAAGHAAHSPDKGRLGALLAVLNDEDPRLGPSARARVFDFDRPELGPLLAFLRAL